MKRIMAFAYVALCILSVAPFSTISMAEDGEAGVIKGSVLNQTLNQKGIGGLEVTLYQYFKDDASEVSRTRTDKAGLFVFQSINTGKDRAYYTATKYKEVDYFSQMLNFKKNKEINLDPNVFEPTDQDKDIHVKMHHVVMGNLNDAFEFKEIMIIENKGNKSYVGSQEVESDKKETLRISLPKEAINVQLMNPSLINTEGDLIDTSAIIPGTKRILFSYLINSDQSNYKFKKVFQLNTDKFNFIFPEKGINVRSEQLKIQGPTENSGERFFYLSGENLTKGSRIAVELSRPRTFSYFKFIIIGLVGLLVGTGFALPLIKRRKYRQTLNEDLRNANIQGMDLAEQKQALLLAIAELDELFESGEINHADYHMERANMLNQAKELSRKLNPGSYEETIEMD